MAGWILRREHTRSCQLFIAIGCGLLLAGCGGEGERLSTVKVSGTVTLNDQPLADVNVNFIPQDPKGHGASGKTDSSGHFELTTIETGDGAMPGEYKVIVARPTADAVAEKEKGISNGGASGPSGPEIPAKYSDPRLTDLKETVGDAETTVTLELKGGS